MIYVPDLENYSCFIIKDSNTLRAYKTIPTRNSEVEYRDYYINSNYLYQDSVQNFSNYSTLPVCLEESKLTTAYAYRNDFPQIIVTFLCIAGIFYFFCSKLVKVLFKGRKLF